MTRSRAGRLALACGLVLSMAACKRRGDTEAPLVWDDEPAPERTQTPGKHAPAWPDADPVALAGGLLTVWLHEPETPLAHVRVCLPTDKHEATTAEVVLVAIDTLRQDLERSLAALEIEVEVDHGPGRVELVLHGRTEQLGIMLTRLSQALAREDPQANLGAARKRLAARIRRPDSIDLAVATVVERLVAAPSGQPLALVEKLEGLPRAALASGWARLTDPRTAVLVVHAGIDRAAARGDLDRLATRWTGRGRGQASRSAVQRLRAPARAAPPEGAKRLVRDDAPPLLRSSVQTIGGGVVVLGRVIPFQRPSDRTLARLAQRLLQEQLDARLVVDGTRAIFLVVVPLSEDDAGRELEAAVAELSAFAQTRQPKQRLFQAAQLWLGARVVQASLDGEDRTGLWSEALDHAEDDAAIGTALAIDAERMLDVDPEALRSWQATWLDPVAGEPGWVWAVAGTSPRAIEQLEQVAKVRPSES